MNSWQDQLQQACPSIVFRPNEPLDHHTTVGIGGPAELFCLSTSKQDFIQIVRAALSHQVPITILGWGANTLIADTGISGLVIKNTAKNSNVLMTQTTASSTVQIAARWNAATADSQMPQFQNIDYDESAAKPVIIEVDSGAALPVLIQQLVQQGITGLQWFTKIPATLGGAVVNNIHGGTHYISDYVESATILDSAGTEKVLLADRLEFAYDYSRFHHTHEYLLSVRLRLFRGDQQKARHVITEWSRQKQKQPARSLGCVFQNISPEIQQKLSLPTPSVGHIVDKELHLSGTRIGDAKISRLHAAFIVNTGHATAKDYLALIQLVHQAVQKKYGISLKPEIFFKGFAAEELGFLQV
ncbi:MAG: hypothetical protein A2632_01015 [Candidatus Pacebacteria bacterium RIFCSPHIGHO2_01_FULL_46_16]|nr:MAG: hypothetical protein A2632_01015 [Candidatus Pacebacteria bacterium RIFCSPHIGHO2_01_FULL_46_16]OGJ20067.1 MAG: hypothetical protein A3J60_00870 [Candidatus Pacebacteria bacterium RIFCSPHIGHO2_02_FULL_46_9]